MNMPTQSNSNDPMVITQFYHSHAFPYLTSKYHQEIRQRLMDFPESLRQRELAPHLVELGETTGDPVWQVFRNYLDKIETIIAEIIRAHSPAFWFHLHRRIRPMLANTHEGKTDDMTVALVRRIAELAYCKYENLDRTDDLGPIIRTRLETFLDGAWYEATAHALSSKLKAKKLYQKIKWTQQIVMTDFRISDLSDVYGVEGLCYEYWWASAAMRAIGKGSIVKWDAAASRLRYKDTGVNPLCFTLYDQRNSAGSGFYTRLGTWLDDLTGKSETTDASRADTIYFAQLTPNPVPKEYPVWNAQTKSMGRGYAATNFEIGTFSLASFKKDHDFMAEPFSQKHGIDLDVVLFALWSASFFGIYTGLASHLATEDQQIDRSMSNFSNVLFRGYSMANFDAEEFAREAISWAKVLEPERTISLDESRQGLNFISLSKPAQKNIGLWSGGKRPVLIPSMSGYMIDLAALMPLLETIFVGVRKLPQAGGESFEELTLPLRINPD
jgi:hypothetical protein